MAWGGGVFTRTYGSTAWQTDASNSVGIVADRHDTNDQDLADGINACINKAGGNAPTADLPMGGYKHTNLGAGSAAAPTFCAGNDQDTGMYSGGANTLNFATNGVERFRIDSSGNSLCLGILRLGATGGEGGELRIRNTASLDNFILDSGPGDEIRYMNSNNTAQLWQNNNVEVMRLTAAGNLGIGATPASRLLVSGGSDAGAPTDAGVKTSTIRISSATTASGTGGAIEFGAGQGAFAQSYFSAIKGLIADGTANTVGDLGFYTRFLTSDSSLTECMRLTSSGNVGIGANSPATKLHLGGSADQSIQVNMNGNAAFCGGVNNTAVLSVNRNPVTGAITDTGKAAAEINLTSTSTNGVITFLTTSTNNTSPTERMRVTPGGNVGIGTAAPSYLLQLNADSAAKPTSNTWTVPSDERIKTNIQPYEKGLEEILQVEPITYDYNGKGGMAAGPGGISILAQALQPIFPECIGSYKGKLNEEDEEDIDILNYNGHAITFALINAIKELSAKLDTLTERVEALEA